MWRVRQQSESEVSRVGRIGVEWSGEVFNQELTGYRMKMVGFCSFGYL